MGVSHAYTCFTNNPLCSFYQVLSSFVVGGACVVEIDSIMSGGHEARGIKQEKRPSSLHLSFEGT